MSIFCFGDRPYLIFALLKLYLNIFIRCITYRITKYDNGLKILEHFDLVYLLLEQSGDTSEVNYLY